MTIDVSPSAAPRILVVSGSVRDGSYTRRLCDATADAVEAAGAIVERWDVADPVLPIVDPAFHHDPRTHPDASVRRLVEAAALADGFVFGTPVYHGSYSGVLKNLLDHIAVRQLMYKPSSLVGFGGRSRNMQAVDALRGVLRAVVSITLPTQVVAGLGDFGDDSPTAGPTDPEIVQRIDRLAHELVGFTVAAVPVRQAMIERYS